MFRLEILFFMQIGIGILLFFVLQKVSTIKKQVDDIISEVKDYITFITEEEKDMDTVIKEQNCLEEKLVIKNRPIKTNNKEDEQTQLIQAVLGEYFP